MGKINKNMCPRAGHSLRHCSLRSISRWHATRRCGGCLWTRSAYWWPLARIRGLTFPCRNKGVTVNISFPGTLNSHLNRLPARGQQALQYAELLRLVEQRLICWPLAGNLFKWLLSVAGNEMFTAPGARLAVTVGHGQSQTVAVGAAQQQPVAVPRYPATGSGATVSILWLDVL